MSDDIERRKFDKMMKGARVTRQINPETGQEMDVLGVDLGIPGREHMRTRRCQNCMAFDTAERAKMHFRHCVQRDKKLMEDQGKPGGFITVYIDKLKRTVLGNFEKRVVGYCLRRARRTDGGASHDFTTRDYLCDHWVDSVGIDTNAHPISEDPLSEELYDKLGETPPTVEAAEQETPEDT